MALDHLTFKQYLETKEQLREAARTAPEQVVDYSIKGYCKFTIDVDGQRQSVSLKPKDTLRVHWLYESIDQLPTAIAVEFPSKKDFNQKYKPKWTDKKIINWITRNSTMPPII